MDEIEICFKGTPVGSAAVTINGLYAHIKCRCRFSDERLYTLFLKNETEDRLLGTCTPQNGTYTLDVRIPKKYVNGIIAIYAAEKYAVDTKRTVPLVPGEPFGAVVNLDRSVFGTENGKPCLIIQDCT